MSAYPGLQRQTLAPNPFFARRNPGATIGGPIKKDKLFFFFNIEHTNQVQAILTQPNTILAQAVAGVYNSPYSGTQTTARMDYHISARHSLFARYSHDGNSGFGQVFSPQSNPSNWVRNINWADQSIIGLTSALTPSVVNDARIQYSYWSNHNLLTTAADCVEPNCIGGGLPGLLAVLGTNIGFGAAEVGANANAPQTRNTRRYEFNDSVNWALGSHRVKFGGQVMRIPSVGQWGFCTPYCEGIFGPQTLGGFFGFPKTLSTTNDFWNSPFLSLSSGIFTGIGVGNSQQPPLYLHDDIVTESQYRLYIQDSWKVKPNFTVNYGLAWDAQAGYFTPLNQSPFLEPILGANNLGKTPNAYKQFQPIVGFAWSPGKSNKTVIRAGGGIYWDSPPGYYHNRTYASNGPVGDGRATLSSQAFVNTFNNIYVLGVGSNCPFPFPGGCTPLPVGAPIPVGALTTMSLRQFDQIYQQQIGAITAKLSPTPPTSGPYSVTGIDVSKSGIEIFPPQFPIARSYQINVGHSHLCGVAALRGWPGVLEWPHHVLDTRRSFPIQRAAHEIGQAIVEPDPVYSVLSARQAECEHQSLGPSQLSLRLRCDNPTSYAECGRFRATALGLQVEYEYGAYQPASPKRDHLELVPARHCAAEHIRTRTDSRPALQLLWSELRQVGSHQRRKQLQ
jgi:hypothetical protein